MENVSNLSPSNLPNLWELDPQNEGHVIQTLFYFAHHPDWRNHHPEFNEYLSILKPYSNPFCTSIKTYEMLLERYSQLFPCDQNITVLTSCNETQIPKNQQIISPKFHAMLSHQTKENNEQKIILDTKDYSQEAQEALSEFIKSGKKVQTASNICELLYLADEHCLDMLKLGCFEYLQENLKDNLLVELLPTLLEISLYLNFKPLTWLCIARGSLIKEDMDWSSEECSPEVKNLMQMLKSFSFGTLAGSIRFDEYTQGKISIVDYSKFSPEKFLLLNHLSQFIPLSLVIRKGFNLEKDGDTLKQLNNLKEFGAKDTFLTSKQQVQEYFDFLAPTKIFLINLKEVSDMTKQEVQDICKICDVVFCPSNSNK